MGFTNYSAFMGILFLITIIFLLIGLSLKEKINAIGNLFLIIAGFMTIMFFASHLKHRNMIKSIEKEMSGDFIIDLKNSELTNYNKQLYDNLVLKIKPDNTFEIMPDTVSFFEIVKGQWSYFDDGDISFIEISGDGKKAQAFGSANFWAFDSPIPKKSMKQVKKVIFVRK